MKSFPFLVLGLALLGGGHAAHAQLSPLGVDAGAYFPSSSRTRAAFGSRFFSIGPGFGPVTNGKSKLSPDFDFSRESRGGNDATLVFAGARYLRPLGAAFEAKAAPSFALYYGAGANLIYADVDAPDFGVNRHGFGVGGSAIAGASFGRHAFAEARYRLMTRAADFDFSGAQIVIGARF